MAETAWFSQASCGSTVFLIHPVLSQEGCRADRPAEGYRGRGAPCFVIPSSSARKQVLWISCALSRTGCRGDAPAEEPPASPFCKQQKCRGESECSLPAFSLFSLRPWLKPLVFLKRHAETTVFDASCLVAGRVQGGSPCRRGTGGAEPPASPFRKQRAETVLMDKLRVIAYWVQGRCPCRGAPCFVFSQAARGHYLF